MKPLWEFIHDDRSQLIVGGLNIGSGMSCLLANLIQGRPGWVLVGAGVVAFGVLTVWVFWDKVKPS